MQAGEVCRIRNGIPHRVFSEDKKCGTAFLFHRPAENVCLCLFLLGNVEQFDFKDQHLIRSDEFSCSALAVGEGGGNEEFVFAADLHQLKSFRPAGKNIRKSARSWD